MFDLGEFFSMLGDGGVAFAESLGEIATAVGAIFWTPGVEGAAGAPTFIGGLTIASLVGGLATFVINWIRGLFKTSTKR